MSTHWRPDTCGCAFMVANDWLSAVPEQVCRFHQDASNPFVAARNENAWKNMVVGFIQDSNPAYPGTFSLGDDGLLDVLVDGLNAKERAVLQSKIDDHFGAGEVKVF